MSDKEEKSVTNYKKQKHLDLNEPYIIARYAYIRRWLSHVVRVRESELTPQKVDMIVHSDYFI